jgi:hypothetical protein
MNISMENNTAIHFLVEWVQLLAEAGLRRNIRVHQTLPLGKLNRIHSGKFNGVVVL